eukprot:scaffold2131_cov113-Isochrysis_galbana.AAC.8
MGMGRSPGHDDDESEGGPSRLRSGGTERTVTLRDKHDACHTKHVTGTKTRSGALTSSGPSRPG